ncbi:hypothetical protein PBI_LUCKY2013_214 [Mycobacterium phage Lucky2013]|nr:hypothetical protein VC71_gp207 [Mycobacterium phage Minerva]YP_009213441.1 hypothetical protein AVV70_gp213 [Mycobacterium phage MiaZeal]ASD50824.1 hypothetical protein PORCELAIN_217 [Mycobacterium phage Porcelain]ASD53605.1 hypothetical protein PBI_LUCKY2013_214 [Mycobacterium phage Lucky2013]AYB69705.1 hypothetical protein SEA_KALAH2_219 [Mycobacterium phage Kalah2]QBI99838.1 hypothetical protein SEA_THREERNGTARJAY_218 [Mycobacterium phage ThreeRngTarjay]QQM15363.1 hypothetical protein 
MSITEQADQLARDMGYETYEDAPVEVRREIAGAMQYVKQRVTEIQKGK